MRKTIITSVVIIIIIIVVGVVIFNKGYVSKQNVIEKIHLAYSDHAEHVIFDGKDMGEGDNIKISNNHIGFIRAIKEVPHLIYDGKDMGEVGAKTTEPGSHSLLFDISADNYAFHRIVENKDHTFYNGKDLGESECFKINGNDYAIAMKINNSYQLMYNGEVIGNLYNQDNKELGMGSICYSFAVKDKNIFYLDSTLQFYKNKEYLGQANYDIFRGYLDGLTTPELGEFSASNENYCFAYRNKMGEQSRIIYNGKDIGFGYECRISGSNMAYQDLSGHIIYNGKDLGKGAKIALKDNDIAFTKNVNGKSHIIFNGKDLGEGFLHFSYSGANENNIISDGNIVFLRRNADDTTNIIYNGADYGEGFTAQIAGNSIAMYRYRVDKSELVFDGKIIENVASSLFILSR